MSVSRSVLAWLTGSAVMVFMLSMGIPANAFADTIVDVNGYLPRVGTTPHLSICAKSSIGAV